MSRTIAVAQHWPYATRRLHTPEKRMAANAVKRAIASGVLKRQPCEVCGEAKSEAHHDDYGKPLEVRWMCRACHRAHHDKSGPAAVTPAQVSGRKNRSFLLNDKSHDLVVRATSQVLGLMDDRGISQAEIARRVGVTRTHVNVLIGGGIKSLKTLATVADAMGCDVDIVISPRDEGLGLS